MRQPVRFKGGPIFQNSGGSGPDDYLIKPVEGGRWTLVIQRWGRHWRGREVGREQALIECEADRAAWKQIIPLQQICVGDNYTRWARMKRKGPVLTMYAADFWAKYGGDWSPKKRESIAQVRRQRDELVMACEGLVAALEAEDSCPICLTEQGQHSGQCPAILAQGVLAHVGDARGEVTDTTYVEYATYMWRENAAALEEQCRQLVEVAAGREEAQRQRDQLLIEAKKATQALKAIAGAANKLPQRYAAMIYAAGVGWGWDVLDEAIKEAER